MDRKILTESFGLRRSSPAGGNRSGGEADDSRTSLRGFFFAAAAPKGESHRRHPSPWLQKFRSRIAEKKGAVGRLNFRVRILSSEEH